jgi:hypothetical protein
MIEETLRERGNNYGNFHTQANLTQTLMSIITQHYTSTHRDGGDVAPPLPHFMMESIHMICHKLARIANGNPYYADSWHDIGGYSQLVVEILEASIPATAGNVINTQQEGIENV